MERLVRTYPKLDVARDMRGYGGIREDLKQATEYISAIEAQMALPSRNLMLWEGLTSSAVIAYGRCFKKSSARLRLTDEVFVGAPETLVRTHGYVIAIRDKHIAHSENWYEENHLVAVLALVDGVPVRVSDTEIRSIRVIGLADPDIAPFSALLNWVIAKVNQAFEIEKARVLEALRTVPLSTLVEQRIEPPIGLFTSPPPTHTRRSASDEA